MINKSETHSVDTPPEAGKRPTFARKSDAKEVGDGASYSGQEYDAAGQAEWREEEMQRALPADGEVHGSGSGAGGGNPGEDFDSDSASGDGYPRTGVEGENRIAKTERR